MFIRFFLLMRERGLKPTLDQWITLTRALDGDMADSSLTGFYQLCRCVLLKSEADFDDFDQVFQEYFEGASAGGKLPDRLTEPLPEDLANWLTPCLDDPRLRELFYSPEHMEILRRLEECIARLLQSLETLQADDLLVGNCAVCVGCGRCARGMPPRNRVGGGSRDGDEGTAADLCGTRSGEGETDNRGNALRMAGRRRFKDFREDNVIDIRQFQLAFRRLRQYSARVDLPETELDIDKTVAKTAENAGLLSIVRGRPRKNAVKLLILFDSDGSMWSYSELSNRLFQSVSKANHFKDLRFYYFHNCVYDKLYTSPRCADGEWVDLDYVTRVCDREYRLIIVGDASMADSELFVTGGNVLRERSNKLPGIEYLRRLKRHYGRSVWLNPLHKEEWNRLYGGRTIQAVGRLFPMYELTVNGLGSAVKQLLAAR
jgi:uncharacterized protein with von Willebrand factor type A (vWA) domain